MLMPNKLSTMAKAKKMVDDLLLFIVHLLNLPTTFGSYLDNHGLKGNCLCTSIASCSQRNYRWPYFYNAVNIISETPCINWERQCLHKVVAVVSTVANMFLTLFQAVLIYVNTLITISQA